MGLGAKGLVTPVVTQVKNGGNVQFTLSTLIAGSLFTGGQLCKYR